MLQKLSCLLLFFCFTSLFADAQSSMGTISGTVKDDNGKPLDIATVAVSGSGIGTRTGQDGKYELEIPAGKNLTVVFSYITTETFRKTIFLQPGEKRVLDVTLKNKYNTLNEFVKKDDRKRTDPGSVYIDPAQANYMPSTVGGIEGMIKMLVGSNNEMTSQYAVRGGNYDENLVYVNDFEIYRPFLVRSGQQEGLSFVNPDLVSGVNFSLGGFQAKYGDKMSSVMDVTYKRPKKFSATAMLSLLGASLSLEGASKNQKLTYLFGVRQKSNQYLLQSQPTKGVYNPSFTDVQGLVNYKFNSRWEMEVIANYARNRFNFTPEEMTSTFGVINQAYQLHVFYTGGEIDQFDSRFGGISTTYKPNDRLRLKFLVSGFQTNEKETYDINGEYLLGELETDLGKSNFGQIKTYLGTGVIQDFARNYLKVNVGDLAHRGSYSANKHFIQWGLDANVTSISDKLHEWERRDSSGYTQPYLQNSLEMKSFYNSSADFNYMRYSGFLQDNFRFNDSLDLTISAGVRFNYSTLNGELVVSPRVQAAYKPKWKHDFVFKAAAGIYAQPPFYREMRDLEGNVNKDLKAQKSLHITAGTDYNFKWSGSPMKFTTEVYYKNLWDLVPYEYDNIRIRYFGKNDGTGYVYGGEARLYGDLVKDAPSWISVGFSKAMQNITDNQIVYKNVAGQDSAIRKAGEIPMPNDQRLMFGMYFQDYLPNNKNFRMHLNLLYATGLPFNPPSQELYLNNLRLPDYKRVDIGFSALLLDGARKERPAHSFFRNVESIWAGLEVFNLLGIQNTISYSWIQDQTTGKTFAVPNRLTARLLNVKLIVKI
ncbi:TonB-dependent receptor [Chitinophagaceae bacterium MMS25-I14]